MQLESRYERLLSRYLSVERMVENTIGLKALIEADEHIDAEKKKIKAEMDVIAHQIRTDFYPRWEPALVRPRAARPSTRMPGISIEAYRVLRLFRRAMTTDEVAAEVAERLAVDFSDPTVRSRLTVNIRAHFNARAREGLIAAEGKPSRWTVVRRLALPDKPDSANILPSPRGRAS